MQNFSFVLDTYVEVKIISAPAFRKARWASNISSGLSCMGFADQSGVCEIFCLNVSSRMDPLNAVRPGFALKTKVVAHQPAVKDDNVRPVERFHLEDGEGWSRGSKILRSSVHSKLFRATCIFVLVLLIVTNKSGIKQRETT